MSHALQAVISPAISQEIADNKEKMVDALYPIMGGMISKYVTQAIKEMTEKINEKIEQGLSFERYKRKVKAKLTGVSETELLLEESSDATIKSIFIIQKETGLLIAESHLKNSEIDDPHMVASMASAIKDFVNDWIEKGKETAEVQLLSYGNATLYIESAGSVYLIAFLDSEPDHEQRTLINEFFAQLIKQESDFFQSFEGDLNAPQIKQIEEMIHDFLHTQTPHDTQEKTSHKNPAKLIFITLGLLLLAGSAYMAKEKYDLYRLEKEIFENTGESIDLKTDDGKLYVEGHLPSYNHYRSIASYIKTHTDKPIVNHLALSPEAFYTTLEKNEKKIAHLIAVSQNKDALQQMQTEMKELQNTLKILQNSLVDTKEQLSSLSENAQKNTQKLASLHKLASVQQKAFENLQKVFHDNDGFQKSDASLDLHNARLFKAGKTVPQQEILKKLDTNLKTYITTLINDENIRPYIKAFIIEGYTDSSGNEAKNRVLSQKRAEAIRDHLLTLPFAKTYKLSSMLKAKGMASKSPIMHNGVEDKEASRRIKIRFLLDKDKILNSLIEKL